MVKAKSILKKLLVCGVSLSMLMSLDAGVGNSLNHNASAHRIRYSRRAKLGKAQYRSAMKYLHWVHWYDETYSNNYSSWKLNHLSNYIPNVTWRERRSLLNYANGLKGIQVAKQRARKIKLGNTENTNATKYLHWVRWYDETHNTNFTSWKLRHFNYYIPDVTFTQRRNLVSYANGLRNIQQIKQKANQIAKQEQEKHRFVFVSMAPQMRFVSQGNSEACEASSLLMALSIKGHANNMSLGSFVDKKVGWYNHGNPNWEVNYRYDRDPFTYSATIYPNGLQRASARVGAESKNITGASKNEIINLLLQRKPIVVEASHHLEIFDQSRPWKQSDHIITLVGYEHDRNGNEYIQYADPLYDNRYSGIRWGTWQQFWNSFRRPSITGERALAVLK